MCKSTAKRLIISFENIAFLTLVLSTMGVGAAFGAVGGVPGPPPVKPVSPCISTGFLGKSGATGSYLCSVRNVGLVSHNVTIDIRDQGNLTDNANASPTPLAPGHGTGVGFSPPENVTASDACVVTTDEGTTDALEDLRVVMEFSSPATETEGEIFTSCAPSGGVAP